MNTNQTWSGKGLFFDSATSRALNAVVHIAPDGITMHVDSKQTYLLWTQLRISTTGPRGYVRIEIKNSNSSVLAIQSAEAVDVLVANHQLRKGLIGKLLYDKQMVMALVAVAAFGVLFFTVGLDFLVDAGVRLVPYELENRLGSAVVSGILHENTVATDSATVVVLAKCADVVKEFDNTGTPTPYKIILIENTNIRNAFALPGGYIILYRGILDSIDDESELFGLLGHEAGHVVERHGMKRIARSALLGFITSLVLGDAKGLSAILLDNGSVLVNLAYDRKEEIEADDLGMEAVQKSAINPHGMVALFEKLKKVDGSAGWASFLSTHPDIDQRVAKMKIRLGTMPTRNGQQRLTQVEWKTLKNSDVQK